MTETVTTILQRKSRTSHRHETLIGVVAALSFPALFLMPAGAQAQEKPGTFRATLQGANPSKQGNGTLGPAAQATIAHGPLPASNAAAAAKAAAAFAARKALAPLASAKPADLAAAGGTVGAKTPSSLASSAPAFFLGFNKPGLGNPATNAFSPPDTTGAIGTTRYIQLVNAQAGIFNRTTGALIGSGTLDDLAGIAPSVLSFDPQIMWDSQTNRFYYVMDSVFSATDNEISFGFSTTASPTNVTTDFCHYSLLFGTALPDYPKLGDSQFFAIIGFNEFDPDFTGSAIVAISKPPVGTTCPAPGSFKLGIDFPLASAIGGGALAFTPVPSNQIDTNPTGYVVAIDATLPSTNLSFFNVDQDVTGFPVFGPPRGLAVPAYAVPPAASQPGVSPTLDTLDGRNTQAVQAIDPRTGTFSFWTQHTVLSTGGIASAVRDYEIDPVPVAPVVLRTDTIEAEPFFLFNAAISSNRMVNTFNQFFGDSFVVEYNVSGAAGAGINPRIVAGSSRLGGPLSFLLVKDGVGPYQDFTCPTAADTCRWGDYSGASPDPAPAGTGPGVVWGTNQYSGVLAPSPAAANWVTQIFALKP